MSAFRPLAAESLRDALRRRIVAAVVVLSLLSLLAVDSCTSCTGGQIVVNGHLERLDQIAGAIGLIVVGTLGLWVIALAGILGADHLQQTLEDGSAALCLARPVSRDTFVLARLVGAVLLAGLAGLVLFAGAGFLLAQRSGLSPGPVLWAGLACAGGALTTAAFAMAASLRLPRIATLFLVLAILGLITLANVLGAAARLGNGILAWIDRFGPPLASSLGLALAPWLGGAQLQGSAADIAFRLALWCALGVGLLVAAFRRAEIRG